MWEMLLAMFAQPASYEVDCLHLLMSIVWLDPVEVWQCDACGAVFAVDEDDNQMVQELARPFVESLQ